MSANLESQIKSAEEEWFDLWKSGPSRLRWNKIPLQVGDTAPDFELQGSTGVTVHLRDFWNDKPALILFWRHYGCSCGIELLIGMEFQFEQSYLSNWNAPSGIGVDESPLIGNDIRKTLL
jgi:AhpC/TSA family